MEVIHQLYTVFDKYKLVYQLVFFKRFLDQQTVVRIIFGH